MAEARQAIVLARYGKIPPSEYDGMSDNRKRAFFLAALEVQKNEAEARAKEAQHIAQMFDGNQEPQGEDPFDLMRRSTRV